MALFHAVATLALLLSTSHGATLLLGCGGDIDGLEFYVDTTCRPLVNGDATTLPIPVYAKVNEGADADPDLILSVYSDQSCTSQPRLVSLSKAPLRDACAVIPIVGTLAWGAVRMLHSTPVACYPAYPCDVSILTDPCAANTTSAETCDPQSCLWDSVQGICLSRCMADARHCSDSQSSCRSTPPCAPVIPSAPHAPGPVAPPSTKEGSLTTSQAIFVLIVIAAVGAAAAIVTRRLAMQRRDRLTMYDTM